MTEQQIIAVLVNSSPGLVLAMALLLLVWRSPAIAAGVKGWQDSHNEGERIRAGRDMANNESVSKAVDTMTDAMKQVMVEQRTFNVERTDNLLKGMRLLEGEIAELREQNRDKDERIEELERENHNLHDEIDELRMQLDKSKARSTRKKGEGNATPPKSKMVGAGSVIGHAAAGRAV